MQPAEPHFDAPQALREMLGYLNLSSGSPDSRFRRRTNELFQWLESRCSPEETAWRVAPQLLRDELQQADGTSAAFAEIGQAQAVIELAFDHVLPAYREFHCDLLHHQTDAALYRPFFVARAFEAILQEGSPWKDTQRIVTGAIRRLNDFIGYRPVAVLHNTQRMEPYPHEWVCPLPLYLRDAGVTTGRYHDLVVKAIEILRQTDERILRQARFDPEQLDELALDPRAYDFDHPVNRRVNYQFGQWDPSLIDNRGQYRRFVITGVTLDCLMERLDAPSECAYDEALFEASAVLAGVILMAAGVSGSGPDDHDSNTTLTTLVKHVAGYRDEFYTWLLEQMPGEHGERLRTEARERRQAFAAVRQGLNQCLSRRRALQMQHVFLATLYARMGFPEASRRQVSMVAIPSARIQCEIDCQLATGRLEAEHGELVSATRRLREIDNLMRRGIECGAIIDPWNILGFGGQFSLFPSLENSVRDHRAIELIMTMEQIFGLHARLVSEAAAAGEEELGRSVTESMDRLAAWWDQFATVEVSGLNSFSGSEATHSAKQVATALAEWRLAGSAAGDVAFWRRHVDTFSSPKAYSLVVDALLEKGDHKASMALLMQWLSQVAETPLEDNEHSFHRLAMRWINSLREATDYSPAERWSLTHRFFDFLEANADEYWQVPRFSWAATRFISHDRDDEAAAEGDDEQDEGNPFAAAYEGVTYQDSTNDGFEGEVFEGGEPSEFELDEEATRITRRLAFLAAVAELWKVASATLVADGLGDDTSAPDDMRQTLANWFRQAMANRRGLRRLLAETHSYSIPPPSGSHDSLVEYDRRQMVKEVLLENTIKTTVATSSAARDLLSLCGENATDESLADWERRAVEVMESIANRDVETLRDRTHNLMDALEPLPLLYVPVSRDGAPEQIVEARTLQQFLSELMTTLPRLGLLCETCDLIQLARDMEADHPVGPGAVSEFDRLFTTGYQALVEALVVASEDWTPAARRAKRRDAADAELIECLNTLTEKLLQLWLAHSSALRLSVLEALLDHRRWERVVEFIKTYGNELFTPKFLNEGNLRAIVHQGVQTWLLRLREEPLEGSDLRLIEDLDHAISLKQAANCLERIIQALLENYAEYNDYNHTTTHSDRGDMLDSLLDFLRLKASYDRMDWNLKPVALAHEILVRRNRSESAELWRRSIAEQTTTTSDHHLTQYAQLVEKYGMRLPTIADRLRECFVRPLEIDRVLALVKPAMEELRSRATTRTFDLLEQEVNELAQTPTGVGLDVPAWLVSLEEEVQTTLAHSQPEMSHRNPDHIAREPLSAEEVREQLQDWEANEE